MAFDLASMLLPADPRFGRYAVVRPGPNGIEGLLLVSRTRGVFAIASNLDEAQGML